MRLLLFPVVPLVLLAAAVAPVHAQHTVVSPVGATHVEGHGRNIFPFASPGAPRHQQIHADLVGPSRIFTRLAFRQDAATSNNTAVRAVDLEMFMGVSRPISQTSFFFAANYVGPRTTTIARKVVNFGPLGQAVTPGPNPFDSSMTLVLDSPFPHAGTAPVIWEVVVYSNTMVGGSGFNAMDADTSTFTPASTSFTGAGCSAAGQALAMILFVSFADMGGLFLANFTVFGAPPNATAFLAVGTSNPNMAIPGLCSNLLTDLVLLQPIGVTSPAGEITNNQAGASTFVLPNTLGGATLYTQVHALDPARPDPIKVANSTGRSGVVPMPNVSRVVNVARILNTVGGVFATEGGFFADSTVGFGLVTQFTFN